MIMKITNVINKNINIYTYKLDKLLDVPNQKDTLQFVNYIINCKKNITSFMII